MSLNVNSQPQDMPADDFLGLALPRSKSQAVSMLIKAYLTQLDPDELHEPKKITNDILYMLETHFEQYNKNANTGAKWRILHDLPPHAIAQIMLYLHTLRNINCSGVNSERDYDILGVYQELGENEGIYISDEIEMRKLIREYNASINAKDMEHVIQILKDRAPRVERCSDPDLIAVNNGIFNYKTKILQPFSPELVFTAKSHTDYNPNAANVIIHNNNDNTDWDIETWVKELFDDLELSELIWQIIGAIIRPNVRWNKSAWFVSEKGNNGKGTLCQLMRNITGEGTYASIQLSDFGKEFMLEPLIGATSIITDENDVGTFIDKAANLKAIITNDVMQVNRKFKKPIAYQFKGFMVQCVNEMPRVKDKSESFYRRQLFIPFSKCYTGIERKYIKEDYLNRQEVLEYALYRVLNTNYYKLDEPAACKEMIEQYKVYNDPVRDFLNEILAQASWDCLPNDLLYEFYKSWSRDQNPNGSIQSRNTFLNDVKNTIDSISFWYYVNSKNPKRVSGRMDCDEPLLNEYNITDWMDNPKTEYGRFKINKKKKKERTGGVFRYDCTAVIDPADDDTDSNDSNK